MDALLKKELQQVNTRPENRKNLLSKLLQEPDFFSEILKLIGTDKEMAPKAARAIELASIQNVEVILPHINSVIVISKSSNNDSVIRAMAKILEILIDQHYSSKNRFQLQENQLQQIVEICFDWLITPQKTAAQVYSMGCLLQLGKDYSWIYTELLQILKKNYAKNSAGYKARARKIIQQIEYNKADINF